MQLPGGARDRGVEEGKVAMGNEYVARERNRVRKREERMRRRDGIPADPEYRRRNKGRMRPVVNVETGREYDSVAAAAWDAMMPQSTVRYLLDHGTSRHGLSFKYLEVPDGR